MAMGCNTADDSRQAIAAGRRFLCDLNIAIIASLCHSITTNFQALLTGPGWEEQHCIRCFRVL